MGDVDKIQQLFARDARTDVNVHATPTKPVG
jgi:hypothetical protein